MSVKTETKTRTRSPARPKIAASLVWFEIPAENLQRASAFYGGLFGWKISPLPGMKDYWHIDTGGSDDSPDGALMARMCPEHPVTNYISVESVTKAMARVQELGGKVHKPKTAVPQMGYFSICQDTENNVFALWERDPKAK